MVAVISACKTGICSDPKAQPLPASSGSAGLAVANVPGYNCTNAEPNYVARVSSARPLASTEIATDHNLLIVEQLVSCGSFATDTAAAQKCLQTMTLNSHEHMGQNTPSQRSKQSYDSDT